MWILAVILGSIAFFLVAVMLITELIKIRKALEHIAYSHKTHEAAEKKDDLPPRAYPAPAPEMPAGDSEDGPAAVTGAGTTGTAAEHIRVTADDGDGYGSGPIAEEETPTAKEYHKTKIDVVEEE